jgi:fluoride exporter
MNNWLNYVAIGAGGIIGAIARWVITVASQATFNTDFPVGTMFINVSGSLFLGWFMTVAGTTLKISDEMRLAIGVGFVGAYTTFSTFCYESTKLLQSGAFYQFAFNVIGSVLLGLIAVRVGMLIAGR